MDTDYPRYRDLKSHAFFRAASGDPMVVTRDGRCSHWFVEATDEMPSEIRGYYVSWGSALGFAHHLWNTDRITAAKFVECVCAICAKVSEYGFIGTATMKKLFEVQRCVFESASHAERTRGLERLHDILRHWEFPLRVAPSHMALIWFGGPLTGSQYAEAFCESRDANFAGARKVSEVVADSVNDDMDDLDDFPLEAPWEQ